MGVLSWILFGFLVGILAKWILPGADPGGFIVTPLIGIAGAFAGSYLAPYAGVHVPPGDFTMIGIFTAIIGAILLLLLWRILVKALY